MRNDDLFHKGATVFIKGKSYVLGDYVPELSGWELWHGGEHVATYNRKHLRNIIEGVLFAEVAA